MKGYMLIGDNTIFSEFTNLINSYSSTIDFHDSQIKNVNGKGFIIILLASKMTMSKTLIESINGTK